MLLETRELLKLILKENSSKEVMRELASIAADLADDLSDEGLNEKAKEMTVFSSSLDDLISGRPFLV